jgi:hypothetical protein
MEYCSAIKNEIIDGIEYHHVKQSNPGSENQRLHFFFHMWKAD